MPTFIALLRGVNVGKARRVPMATWRELLVGLGHTGVSTLLNSGNAVFRATGRSEAAHARAIAASLQQALGLEVPVIVKSANTLAAIVRDNPFTAADPSRLLVVFAPDAAGLSALQSLEPLLAPGEGLHPGAHAAYLHCAGGLLESRAGAALLGPVGRGATTRNWATTLELAALTDPAAVRPRAANLSAP